MRGEREGEMRGMGGEGKGEGKGKGVQSSQSFPYFRPCGYLLFSFTEYQRNK